MAARREHSRGDTTTGIADLNAPGDLFTNAASFVRYQ